jgi:cystathionine beta-lyase/cystathionine gamma-synthase
MDCMNEPASTTGSRARLHPQTRAVHTPDAGLGAARPVSTPIYQASAFAFDDPQGLADALAGPDGGFGYSRYSNPTSRALEQAVADLEGGAAGLTTASGSAAVAVAVLARLGSGDHLVAQLRLYGGTSALLARLERSHGISVSYISGADPAELGQVIRPATRLLFLETIANPTARVGDLPGLLAAGRAAGLTCVVDNTFATPMLCRPIEHGADVVLHSATKYLGGHDDITLGVVVFAEPALHHIAWRCAVELGVTADPFASWLAIRGLKTLPLRIGQHCANAGFLASRLAAHPAVSAVYYPGLPDDPGHGHAIRFLSGFGGVLAFDVAGGRAAGRAFLTGVRLARVAASLGGTETLVLHPATTSHAMLDTAALRAAGIGEGLIRISAGLEHPDDLWADIEQALAAI